MYEGRASSRVHPPPASTPLRALIGDNYKTGNCHRDAA